jgi:hypothetical protein
MTTAFKPPKPDAIDFEKVPDHRGQPRDVPAEFFAPPAAEIGTILSAESTLRQGRGPKPLVVRLLFAAALGAGIYLVCIWLGSFSNLESDHDGARICAFVLGPLGFLLVIYFTRFNVRCTYVGDRGAARYTLKSRRDADPRADLLIFEQTAECHAAQTHHSTNGIYTQTTYDYYWTNPDNKRLLRVKGSHRGKRKPVKRGNAWLFANATEASWSRHFLTRAQKQLEAEGSIPFRVDKTRWIRVGPGFLEFHFTGDPVRLNKEEIASVTLGSGNFSFKHKDATWLSRSGKFSFQYGKMANARVFLLALEKLMGYKWS